MRYIGRLLFLLAWPAYFVYVRVGGERSRVLVVCGNEVLVLTGWIGSGKWGLPGGGTHKGETTIAGAVRELYEEAGIAVNASELKPFMKGRVNQWSLPYNYQAYVLSLDAKPALKRQWYEVAKLRWVDYRELTRHNAEPDVLAVVGRWFGAGSASST